MTVQPVIDVSPIGRPSLHGSAGNVPSSKLPFWNGAANAEAAHTSANNADAMRFMSSSSPIVRSVWDVSEGVQSQRIGALLVVFVQALRLQRRHPGARAVSSETEQKAMR